MSTIIIIIIILYSIEFGLFLTEKFSFRHVSGTTLVPVRDQVGMRSESDEQ